MYNSCVVPSTTARFKTLKSHFTDASNQQMTMGDMAKDGESRMRLTLQGYDQVIALSQTNINQSLKRYFVLDETRMSNFKAIIGTEEDPDYSLIGKIHPPSIELIDADKADQGIYTIKFQKGAKYTYWGPDPANKRGPQKNFGMEKCSRMPDDVAAIFEKAGSYSVDQLVVIFGTADLMDFDWNRAKFPGMEDRDVLFVGEWLMSLRTAEPGKSHNVLGYTVKIDVEGDPSREQLLEKIGDTPPSFPPMKVQFQTMANKPDAASKGDSSDPYNAFLFAEMCGIPDNNKSRQLPQRNLQWSGNWFYGSIGGTLAMSSVIFLQEFVGRLVKPIHMLYTDLADPLAKRQTWDAQVRMARVKKDVQFMGAWVHEPWVRCGENQWVLQSTSASQHKEIPWEDGGKSFTVQVNVQAVMTSWLKPSPRSSNLDIEQRLQIVTKWSNFSIQYAFDATSSFSWSYAVQLAAVNSDGELSPAVTYTRDERPALMSTITERGVLIRGVGSRQTEDEKQHWDSYQKILMDSIENKMPSSTDFTNKLAQGLGGQKKFVFPGGGTFDISHPVFNEAGDLLLSLVYRQGKL
ncbi:hypothetical protein LX36DRAFT_729504 [Colletotrichum falcatum]|nr:hypothetical protein LX36DRAFT_729504 [Colletotrichum falcatum]